MERRPEAELMDEMAQAEAYAGADFEEPHSKVLTLFTDKFSGLELAGPVLDIGCGPGDVSCRFVRRFAGIELIGVDGSAAMLALAERRRGTEMAIAQRLTFVNCVLPSTSIPDHPYRAIISTSFLHHLHHPEVLWHTVTQLARPGCVIFVVDLMRPPNEIAAQRLVDQYTVGEPAILRRDFHHSLLAAFTVHEVRQQLKSAGLALRVEPCSDRHLVAWGRI
jgi:trans-aconitate methyltransferase